MLTKNKMFSWKRKTAAFWQHHGIHGIWRKSRFPWFDFRVSVIIYCPYPYLTMHRTNGLLDYRASRLSDSIRMDYQAIKALAW